MAEALEPLASDPLDAEEKAEVETALAGLVIRPLRLYKELQRCQKDAAHARAWLASHNLDNLMKRDFEHLYKHKRNALICISGAPGEGKSVTARSLALLLLDFAQTYVNTNAQVYLSFSNTETLQIVEGLQEGDLVDQDEIKRESGEDSQIMKNALLNVEEQVRENQNSFLFVSPTLKGFEDVATHLFESIGFIQSADEASFNVVKVYDRNKPAGHCFIRRRIDSVFEAYYQKRKTANVQTVLQTRGLATVTLDLDRLKKDAALVVHGLRTEFGAQFLDVKAKLLPIFARSLNIPGSGAYIKHVANWTQIELEKLRLSEPPTPAQDGIITSDWQQQDFTKSFFEFATRTLVAKNKFPDEDTAKRFTLYYITSERNLTWVDVRETLGEKQLPDSIRKFVHERTPSRTFLGNLLEEALLAWLLAQLDSSLDLPLSRESGPGHCDLHLAGHRLCINCKWRLEEKAAQTEHCSPEFQNASQYQGAAYVAQFTKGFGLRIFRAHDEYVRTGSSEEITLEQLIERIKKGGDSS